jgi:NCAIR mutase (PurE)-related protein
MYSPPEDRAAEGEPGSEPTLDPFSSLRDALSADADAAHGEDARLDLGREGRAGIPEVIYAPGKPPELVEKLVAELLERTGRAIVSRPDAQLHDRLRRLHPDFRLTGRWAFGVEDPSRPPALTGGRVGVLTAGSSDAPYSEEARIVAAQMGCETWEARDVGVAGLHRLFPPLRRLLEARVDALVVAAGMDGALPSVVAGLVDVPVIGLPTSTGYGAGGRGVAALLTMLQSCAPGLAVVNIDNGVGAGSMAALIANRAARARGGHKG